MGNSLSEFPQPLGPSCDNVIQLKPASVGHYLLLFKKERPARVKRGQQAASRRWVQLGHQRRKAGGRPPGNGHCGERRGETRLIVSLSKVQDLDG